MGIKWPQWHTLMLAEQVKADMRVVCLHDGKKDASEAGKNGLSEKIGSEARV